MNRMTMTKTMMLLLAGTALSAQTADEQAGKPVKVTDVWVVFKTHLDIGYTETIPEVMKTYRTDFMDKALGVIEQDRHLPPEKRFAWTMGGWSLAHVLGPLQEPARRNRIEQAFREGSIAVHAIPFTSHTDSNDLEDLVRGLGFSSQLARKYNKPLPIGAKMTDVPGHSWVLPTLLSHAGVRFLQIGCNATSAYARVPELFWWEGPDGSRILCSYTRFYGSSYYGSTSRGGKLTLSDRWPCRNYLEMRMTPDNVGPPSAEYVEKLRKSVAEDLPGVRLHFGTFDDFVHAVIAENPQLEVIRGDMPDSWIHGWMSMPVEAKQAHNFRALAPAVETLDTQLKSLGLHTGELAPALAQAYEQSNLYSEHTFGPDAPNQHSWNSGTPRYLYGKAFEEAHARGAYNKYEQVFDHKRAFARKADEIIRGELGTRLDLLTGAVKSDGPGILVYNGLPWKRSGIVEVPGKPGKYIRADDVPANGYKVLPDESGEPVHSDKSTLETKYFSVVFDLKRGGIASLVDRQTGRELADKASPYAIGQFLHERFDDQKMTAYHNAYVRGGYRYQKTDLPENTVYSAMTPPTWSIATKRTDTADLVTMTATDALGLAKGISLVFTFPCNQAWLDVEWRVNDKKQDPIPEGGWLCFPIAVREPKFLLGRLGGPIDPTKDIIPGANRHLYSVTTGVAVTDPGGLGMGICPINSRCVSLGEPGLWKFSLDYLPKQPTVFVNLYNNQWNTNFPEWIGGSWSSRVRLWPVGSVSLTENLAVESWEARLPLLAVPVSAKEGKLPSEGSGLELSRKGVLLTAFGANPDGKGTILRLWEQGGVSGEVTVNLPKGFNPSRMTPVNLRGEVIGKSESMTSGSFKIELKAFAPASYVLE